MACYGREGQDRCVDTPRIVILFTAGEKNQVRSSVIETFFKIDLCPKLREFLNALDLILVD